MASDEWLEWLREAHAIVKAWEDTRTQAILPIRDASSLAELIAGRLEDAYRRGRDSAASWPAD